MKRGPLDVAPGGGLLAAFVGACGTLEKEQITGALQLDAEGIVITLDSQYVVTEDPPQVCLGVDPELYYFSDLGSSLYPGSILRRRLSQQEAQAGWNPGRPDTSIIALRGRAYMPDSQYHYLYAYGYSGDAVCLSSANLRSGERYVALHLFSSKPLAVREVFWAVSR